MTNSKAILATTSKEIREHAQAARGQSERDIILAPVDFSDHSEAALIQTHGENNWARSDVRSTVRSPPGALRNLTD